MSPNDLTPAERLTIRAFGFMIRRVLAAEGPEVATRLLEELVDAGLAMTTATSSEASIEMLGVSAAIAGRSAGDLLLAWLVMAQEIATR